MQRSTFPLVFLHGFLGTSEDWISVKVFLNSYDCRFVDLPGHGTCPFTTDFTSLIPDVPKMHLIGYSMGGRLAMQYAQKFPEKIETLTVLSSHPGLKSAQEKENRLKLDLVWANKMIQNFDDFLEEWYDQPIFSGYKPNLTLRRKQNPRELAQTLIHYSLGKQEAIRPENALFVVGERDQKYRELYRQAIVIPNAGHMVHLENPESVAAAIKKRIES